MEKSFQCEICKYLFTQNVQLNRNVSSVHEGNKPLKCDICEYKCSQKTNM